MNRRAEHAPSSRHVRPIDQVVAELEVALAKEYSLESLPDFSIVVEGWTDVSYLEAAARVLRTISGDDPLEVPLEARSDGEPSIRILTPGTNSGPVRGGVPQMVRLAEKLKPYVFEFDMFKGLIFVFDHDKAGIEGATSVRNMGYRDRVLTIDPKLFPGSCAKKQVVIEDLLSLDVQKKFFELGNAWCSVEYENGHIVRFDWGHNSKAKLRDFVCSNGDWQSLKELARVLVEVRKAIGLPYSYALF